LSERKGNHWLELTRNWILEANQAKNLILEENFSGMKHFLQRISLNRQISEQKILINFTSSLISSQNYPPKRVAKPRARWIIQYGGP